MLVDEPSASEEVWRPGRPKGSGNRATIFNPEDFAPKKRRISAEGGPYRSGSEEALGCSEDRTIEVRIKGRARSSQEEVSQASTSGCDKALGNGVAF